LKGSFRFVLDYLPKVKLEFKGKDGSTALETARSRPDAQFEYANLLRAIEHRNRGVADDAEAVKAKPFAGEDLINFKDDSWKE
jgi:hypothetical protein